MPPNSPAALFVLCGPSCAGKDSLITKLLESRPDLAKVTTSTTRPPREGEVPGKSYHFFERADFESAKNKGEFLETAAYGEDLYGTTKQAVADVYESGKLPVLILDVQGVKTVSDKSPIAVVFIMAPIETIEKRIRATRPPEQVEKRLSIAKKEIEIGLNFEYCLNNEDGALESAAVELIEYYDQRVRPRLMAYKQQMNQKSVDKPKLSR